jgi:hypothetical protein
MKRSTQLRSEALEPRHLLAAAPLITEFMASNGSTLLDGDGEASDWIELFNAGDEPVDLAGWHLTDRAADLARWTFPSTVIEPGAFLIVFASGKDMVDPQGYLHTNFALDADGEYIALVRPDGATVVSEFGPGGAEFPQQFSDVSYGISMDSATTTLITHGAEAEVLIPTAADAALLGALWTEASFVPGASGESAWISGPTAIGYNRSSSAAPSAGAMGTSVLAIDFNHRSSPALTQPNFLPFVLGGTGIQSSATQTYGDYRVTVTDIGGFLFDDRLRSQPVDAGDFSESLLLRDFVFSRATGVAAGLDVRIDGLEPGAAYHLTAWSYDASSTGERVSTWMANGAVAAASYTFDGAMVPTSNDTYQFAVTVEANAAGEILLSGRQHAASTSVAVFLNALRIETAVMPPGEVSVLRVDMNARSGGDTQSGFESMTLSQNGKLFDSGIRLSLSALGGATLDDRLRSTPNNNPPRFQQSSLYRDFIFANGTFDGAGMELAFEGLTPNQPYNLRIWSYDSGSPGGRHSDWVQIVDDNPVELATQYGFNGAFPPTQDNLSSLTVEVVASSSGTVVVQGRRQGGTSHGVFVNAVELAIASVASQIGTDVGDAMFGKATSAYVRVPFDLPAEADIMLLDLNLHYDAGFVAYLNGQEVARDNVPGAPAAPLPHDAAALFERGAAVLVPRTFNLTPHIGLLNFGGPNVLAIRALNSQADDENLFLLPELVAHAYSFHDTRYFLQPTPGVLNSDGVLGFLGAVMFSADRGFYNEPFALELSTVAPEATILYTLDGSRPQPGSATTIVYSGPIAITTTTTIRAAAQRDGYEPTGVATHTYLFLEHVLTQSRRSNQPTTWTSSGGTFPASYSLDPRVLSQWDDNRPGNTDFGIREAMLSLPTMSLVMHHDDWWNSSSGIYVNPQRQGEAWRRPVSVEYIDPATGETFQVNAGVQTHGGASRDFLRTPKKSFRLLFRPDFDGPGTMRFPLIPDSPVDRFNTLVLKGGFTDSFPTRTATSRYSPLESVYFRDSWMRDSQVAMGHLSAYGTWVHLFINGQYWGIYNPMDRPDEAFLARHTDTEREDWDIVKDFNELFRGSKTIWNEMFAIVNSGSWTGSLAQYNLLQGLNANGVRDSNLTVYLDVDNLIDFMLLHFYAHVEDWPHHNWYAARHRGPGSEGFQFFVWDQEIALDGRHRDRTNVSDDGTPARLYSRLRASAEFRLRFADRVHLHLFNDGVLTNQAAAERWMKWADRIETAIVAESARWGNYREGEVVTIDSGQSSTTIPLMTVDHFRAEVARVQNQTIPQSRTLLLQRLTSIGLYPSVAAPTLSPHGGQVAHGAPLAISAAVGTIYYTIDGSDPRLPGGAVNPTATVYSSNVPLVASGSVKARVFASGQWSALVEASYIVKMPLRVTELHYNPRESNDVTEFVEVTNIGNHPVNLAGIEFIQGIGFTFGQSILEPGGRVVVVHNRAEFKAKYPHVPDGQIAGEFSGRLDNAGERITLADPNGGVIQSFRYERLWQPTTDNLGRSLVVVDPYQDLELWELADGWRASFEVGGSPGERDLMLGDLNADYRVGLVDLVILKSNVGLTSGASREEGDLNRDGAVSRADIVLMVPNWGRSWTPDVAATFASVDESRGPLEPIGLAASESAAPARLAAGETASERIRAGGRLLRAASRNTHRPALVEVATDLVHASWNADDRWKFSRRRAASVSMD